MVSISFCREDELLSARIMRRLLAAAAGAAAAAAAAPPTAKSSWEEEAAALATSNRDPSLTSNCVFLPPLELSSAVEEEGE